MYTGTQSLHDNIIVHLPFHLYAAAVGMSGKLSAVLQDLHLTLQRVSQSIMKREELLWSNESNVYAGHLPQWLLKCLSVREIQMSTKVGLQEACMSGEVSQTQQKMVNLIGEGCSSRRVPLVAVIRA